MRHLSLLRKIKEGSGGGGFCFGSSDGGCSGCGSGTPPRGAKQSSHMEVQLQAGPPKRRGQPELQVAPAAVQYEDKMQPVSGASAPSITLVRSSLPPCFTPCSPRSDSISLGRYGLIGIRLIV